MYKDYREVFAELVERSEEGRQKTFLGRYKSPLVLEWQLLIKIYESNSVYLAEYGRIIQQVQGFDLPAARKQLQTAVRSGQEAREKAEEARKGAKEQDRVFKALCEKLGLMPTLDEAAMERQAVGMVREVVPRFRDIESNLRGLKEVVEYYRQFNQDNTGGALDMLRYMAEHGDENRAVFEARKAGKELGEEEQGLREAHKYDLYERFDQIVYAEEPVIEIGENATDWDKIDVSAYVQQEASEDLSKSWAVVEEKPLNKYEEEETLLYCQDTRQKLITDLEELAYFLRVRLSELSATDSLYAVYQEQSRSDFLKTCD